MVTTHTLCVYVCGPSQDNLKVETNIKMGKKGDLSDFEHDMDDGA